MNSYKNKKLIHIRSTVFYQNLDPNEAILVKIFPKSGINEKQIYYRSYNNYIIYLNDKIWKK